MPLKTRKRFGQHFLHDPGVLKRIVEAVAPARGDHVVEIGPGEGALTRPLLELLDRLTVIEIDRDLAAGLAREFAPSKLTVVVADVLDFDFSSLPGGLRVVGNLPYNISTPILFRLARYAAQVRDLHFMLQKEVVDRMVAKHSTADYGRLSVMLQVRFGMQKLFSNSASSHGSVSCSGTSRTTADSTFGGGRKALGATLKSFCMAKRTCSITDSRP